MTPPSWTEIMTLLVAIMVGWIALQWTEIGTLLVAIMVGWIALQQYITNRERLRLDLFDKRYAIYKATRDLFNQRSQQPSLTQSQVFAYWAVAHESVFLFWTDEVFNDLEKIRRLASDLIIAQDVLDSDTASPSEKSKAKDDVLRLGSQLSECEEKLVKLFEPHMRFKKLFEPHMRFKKRGV